MPFRFYSSSCIPSAFGIGGVDISCMNEVLLLLLLAPILIEMREVRQTIRINFYSLYYEIHCASVRPIFLTYMTGIYHLNYTRNVFRINNSYECSRNLRPGGGEIGYLEIKRFNMRPSDHY